MKTQIHITKMAMVALALIGHAIFTERSIASCSYGPVTIICHEATSSSWTGCCASLVYQSCGGNGGYHKPVAQSSSTTEGRVNTCGGGDSAPTLGASFEGLCAWFETYVHCDGPVTVDRDGPVTLNTCEGTCGGCGS